MDKHIFFLSSLTLKIGITQQLARGVSELANREVKQMLKENPLVLITCCR